MNYSKEKIDEIFNENKKLKIENESMKKILGSKRFLAAEKIANVFNSLFPAETSRRKIIGACVKPIKKLGKKKNQKLLKKIDDLAKGKKRVIIMHSIVWSAPLKQRPHHLARCLANNPDSLVIYFEPDEQLKKYRKLKDNFITVNSWEVIYEISSHKDIPVYFFFNNVSNIEFERIERINNSGCNIVYEYIDEFHEDVSGALINQLDNWYKLPKLRPYMILASANKLFDEAKKHFSKSKVILSKNAVIVEDFDYRKFEDSECPEDLRKIINNKKPIVGYYGALAHWLDYDLITKTAMNHPEWNFVLLGVNYQNALEKLNQNLDNIYYLGPKKYEDLAKYSSKFNCAIIPFGTGQIAKGTSPVKLFEYMAMGLPTVGTRDLYECRGYEYVYLAKNSDEFAKYISKSIDEQAKSNVKKKLLEQAQNNSWQSRADDIMKNLK